MEKAASIYDIKQENKNRTTHHITAAVNKPIYRVSECEQVFFNLFDYINRNNIHILQERIYGNASTICEIFEARKTAANKTNQNQIPATFVEGAPCIGGAFAGIHITGVSFNDNKASIKTIKDNNKPIGRVFENRLVKEIFLSGISDYQQAESLEKQVSLMFYKARKILAKENANIRDIIRTWIYFPRILDWYGEFNKARNRRFKEFGLISEKGVYLPASTGIGGKRFKGEECFMDLLALIPKSDEIKISVMDNKLQNQAFDYGSAFSRGIKVSYNNKSSFYISGTASIDNKGKTTYYNDPQGQITETLLNIASLLESEGAGLKNIARAAAYCKNKEVYEKAKQIIKSFDLEDIPFIFLFADVCREELLFEAGAIAAN
ncbi:MAG: hypothetical protein JRJ44_01930 [Deltaproteobacteria bacterium]|nr:hypothetical protein [Deltaproteobacteria bacterium]